MTARPPSALENDSEIAADGDSDLDPDTDLDDDPDGGIAPAIDPRALAAWSRERRVVTTVSPDEAGGRLDQTLAGTARALSRSRVKALVTAGHATIDGATVRDPAVRVKPGQALTLTVPALVDAAPEPENIALTVVYEDDALIVIDKPAGLVVHPAPGNATGTLVNALLHHCAGTLSGINGVKRPGIVHRIDKETSGLLVVAKHEAAHAGLAAQFAAHDLERVYRAVIWGAPAAPDGTIEANIGRDPRDRKRMTVVAADRGKTAVTHWRMVRRYGLGAALIDCTLETGRTHQIRVHMTAIGHPLIGDPVYGRATGARRATLPEPARTIARNFPRQALHAAVLGFRHPISGKALRFESPLPPDLSALLTALATAHAPPSPTERSARAKR